MDETDKNIPILRRKVWCFKKSNDRTISSTWISQNMKVPPQFWCSPSKNYLSQAVAAQTWAKKNAAFRWGPAFLTVHSLRHFHVASFPSAAQRYQKLCTTTEESQTQPETAAEHPDLVGRVRLSSQERSVPWETSLSWDVSHRRPGSLSQEPTAGKLPLSCS